MELSYVGRRVLAHLPAWVEDEKAHVEAEGGPDVSVRSYTVAELTERLLEDHGTPDMTEAEVERVLEELSESGLCVERKGGHWRMTKQGFEALTDPTPPENQTPGPAVLELHPGKVASDARGD